jgi:hypothetical protein
MNIIALLMVTLAINTWGKPIFSLDTIPDYFSSISADGTCGTVAATTTQVYNTTTLPMGSTSV